MKRFILALALIGCSSAESPALLEEAPPVDPLAGAGELVTLAENIQFGEGPLWSRETDQLLFCEFKADRISTYDANAGLGVFRMPAGGPAALARSRDGALFTAELMSRRVTRTDAQGAITIVTDNWQGARLNGPNDLVFADDGSFYFSDPKLPYITEFDLDFSGVFRVSPNGEMTLLFDQLWVPNGVALSPDESVLYVVGSVPPEVWAIDLVDGLPSGAPRLLIAEAGFLPDGMTVDDHGNLYVAEDEGVRVYTAMGELLGILETPTAANNCAFGGPDRSTLFILAEEALYSVDLEVMGPP